VVGVSGGPDSMALLDLMVKYAESYRRERGLTQKITIVVAHLNHGIRGKEADQDQEFVRRRVEGYNFPRPSPLTANWRRKGVNRGQGDKSFRLVFSPPSGEGWEGGVKFVAKKVDAKKFALANKLNLEEAARILRYEFFEVVAKREKADFIVTAHTLDDQVETILMRFLRGSGIVGLAGVLARRGNIIRPLLKFSRAEILKYCQKHKVQYRIDKTNFDQKILRNRIRLKLIPELLRYNPNFKTSIVRMAETFRFYGDELLENAKRYYKDCIKLKTKKKIVLDLKRWQTLPLLYKTEVLRYALREFLGSTLGFGQVHFEEIMRLLEKSEPKKFKNLPRGLRLTKMRDRFIINYQ